MITFDGFRSLCEIPWECKWATPFTILENIIFLYLSVSLLDLESINDCKFWLLSMSSKIKWICVGENLLVSYFRRQKPKKRYFYGEAGGIKCLFMCISSAFWLWKNIFASNRFLQHICCANCGPPLLQKRLPLPIPNLVREFSVLPPNLQNKSSWWNKFT